MAGKLKNIPIGWKVKLSSDVLFFQEGPGVRKWQFREEGVKLLNGGNINNNRINLSSTKNYLSEEEAFNKYKHFLIDEGDLLIACSGITVSTFYKKIAFIQGKDLPLCLNTSTMRFKSIKDIELNYFFYYLQTKYFTTQIQKLITGSAQLNFGPSHMKKIEVLLPPLDQQKKIVAILDAADAYRQKTKALIEKYDELTQSLFLDMFGDPVSNPKNLPTKTLGELCKFYSGKAWKKAELGSGGYKIVRISNLHKPSFPYWHYEGEMVNRHKVEAGDLLFSWAGVHASIDSYIYKGETAMINQHIYNIKPINEMSKLYLYHLLQLHLENLRGSLGGGVGQFHLKKSDVTGIKVILPDDSEMINYISNLTSINKQKIQAQTNLAQGEKLFNNLLQKAFKGKLTE